MQSEISRPVDQEFKIDTKIKIELAKLGDATYLLYEQELDGEDKIFLPPFVQGKLFMVPREQYCRRGCYTSSEGYRSKDGIDFISTRRKYCKEKPDIFRIWVTKSPPPPPLSSRVLKIVFGI